MIFTVIADDHPLVRASLIDLLGRISGIELIAETASGKDTLAIVRERKPDLLLLDIDMPEGSGSEVYHQCRRWSPDTKIVILSGASDQQLLLQLYRQGADAVLRKDSNPDQIRDAVERVLAGRRYCSMELLALENLEISLSRRELAILQLIAEGHTNRSIADRLGISVKTVDGHRTNLMRKLDARSAAQLVVNAVRLGFLNI